MWVLRGAVTVAAAAEGKVEGLVARKIQRKREKKRKRREADVRINLEGGIKYKINITT